jgi:hypothetical protein
MRRVILFLSFFVMVASLQAETNPKKKSNILFEDNKQSVVFEGAGIKDGTYTTALGLRFGWEGGITLKHFISSDRAIEGILSSGWGRGGVVLTGLYEIHKNAFDVERLNWLYGVGGHIGFYNNRWWDRKHTGGPILGIDGIIGMEYHIKEIPFVASIDIKPSIDILGFGYNRFIDTALSIRYVFK